MSRFSAKSLWQWTLRKVVYSPLLSLQVLSPFEQIRIVHTKSFKPPKSKVCRSGKGPQGRQKSCSPCCPRLTSFQTEATLPWLWRGEKYSVKGGDSWTRSLGSNPYLTILREDFSGCLWLNYHIYIYIWIYGIKKHCLPQSCCKWINIYKVLKMDLKASCERWLWCQLLASFSPLSYSIAQVCALLSPKGLSVLLL